MLYRKRGSETEEVLHCHGTGNLGTFPVIVVRGEGVVGQPKFLGKLVLEIVVYQEAPPIGGNFGDVSGSLRLLSAPRDGILFASPLSANGIFFEKF